MMYAIVAVTVLVISGCSSDSNGDGSATTGTGSSAGGGGAAGSPSGGAAPGGSGGEVGDGGDGASGGAPTYPFIEFCASFTTPERCNDVVPDPVNYPVVGCSWWEVEVLPNADSCLDGRIVGKCLSRDSAGTGGCTDADCPAEQDGNAYFAEFAGDGSVNLIHFVDPACTMITPPFGYEHLSSQHPDPPEAYLCRCFP